MIVEVSRGGGDVLVGNNVEEGVGIQVGVDGSRVGDRVGMVEVGYWVLVGLSGVSVIGCPSAVNKKLTSTSPPPESQSWATEILTMALSQLPKSLTWVIGAHSHKGVVKICWTYGGFWKVLAMSSI